MVPIEATSGGIRNSLYRHKNAQMQTEYTKRLAAVKFWDLEQNNKGKSGFPTCRNSTNLVRRGVRGETGAALRWEVFNSECWRANALWSAQPHAIAPEDASAMVCYSLCPPAGPFLLSLHFTHARTPLNLVRRQLDWKTTVLQVQQLYSWGSTLSVLHPISTRSSPTV